MRRVGSAISTITAIAATTNAQENLHRGSL
jgi:hypothetical protein